MRFIRCLNFATFVLMANVCIAQGLASAEIEVSVSC